MTFTDIKGFTECLYSSTHLSLSASKLFPNSWGYVQEGEDFYFLIKKKNLACEQPQVKH